MGIGIEVVCADMILIIASKSSSPQYLAIVFIPQSQTFLGSSRSSFRFVPLRRYSRQLKRQLTNKLETVVLIAMSALSIINFGPSDNSRLASVKRANI